MENFSSLKEFVSIKKKSFLISSVDIIEECATFEPTLADYVITLNRDKMDDFKDYIRESDIRDKEHTLKSLERIPAAVMRVMVNRINMESLTLGFINEYGSVQGVLDWYNGVSVLSEEAPDDASEDTAENLTFDNMFSELDHLAPDAELDTDYTEETNIPSEEDSFNYVTEKPKVYDFPKTEENNEIFYKELTMGVNELQENVRYLIGTVNLLAVKNGLNIRDERGILTTNEILKVVASMREYSDKQFRDIIESVFLKAQSDEQRRIVSDILGEILNYIETNQEEKEYE